MNTQKHLHKSLILAAFLFTSELLAFPISISNGLAGRVITFSPAVELADTSIETNPCENTCIGVLYDENQLLTDTRCALALSAREETTQIIDHSGRFLGFVESAPHSRADQGFVSVSTYIEPELLPVRAGDSSVNFNGATAQGYCLRDSIITNTDIPFDLTGFEKNSLFSNSEPVAFDAKSWDIQNISPGSPIFLGEALLCVMSGNLCLRPESKDSLRAKRSANPLNVTSRLGDVICRKAGGNGFSLLRLSPNDEPSYEEYSKGRRYPNYSRTKYFCALKNDQSHYVVLKIIYDRGHSNRTNQLSVELHCYNGQCLTSLVPFSLQSIAVTNANKNRDRITDLYTTMLKALFRVAPLENANEILSECSGFSFVDINDQSLQALEECINPTTTTTKATKALTTEALTSDR